MPEGTKRQRVNAAPRIASATFTDKLSVAASKSTETKEPSPSAKAKLSGKGWPRKSHGNLEI
jgi:hypothetical protein